MYPSAPLEPITNVEKTLEKKDDVIRFNICIINFKEMIVHFNDQNRKYKKNVESSKIMSTLFKPADTFFINATNLTSVTLSFTGFVLIVLIISTDSE